MTSCWKVWTEVSQRVMHVTRPYHYPVGHVHSMIHHVITHPFMVASIVCVAGPIGFGILPPASPPIANGTPGISMFMPPQGGGGIGDIGTGFGSGLGGLASPFAATGQVASLFPSTTPHPSDFIPDSPPIDQNAPPISPPVIVPPIVTTPVIVPPVIVPPVQDTPEPSSLAVLVGGMITVLLLRSRHRR